MITTQHVPSDVTDALAALGRISDDEPDLELALCALHAAAILRVCDPPYPPSSSSNRLPLPAREAVDCADLALQRAIEAARTAEEAVRIATARAALRGQSGASFPW